MKQYLILYCIYDPAFFQGYYKIKIEAIDYEVAERLIKEKIDSVNVNAKFEYHIYEITKDFNPKLYDKTS